MKLTIELVPSTAWEANVRSSVSKKEWDILRKACYKKADYKCECCGGKGPKHPVECHEIWDYDEKNFMQTLLGLIALCPDCHKCKHMGYARISGNYDRALKHLAKVNGLSIEEATTYVNECFAIYEKRSKNNWQLDITILEEIKK